MTVTIRRLRTPELSIAGAAKGRRGEQVVVVVDAALSPRRQQIAALKLMSDAEYVEWLSLPSQRAPLEAVASLASL